MIELARQHHSIIPPNHSPFFVSNSSPVSSIRPRGPFFIASKMASKAFFDPVAALRAAPLLTSTCSLWFAWDQHFFLHIFNKPELRAKSNDLLPTYFRFFFRGGVTRVLVLISLTLSSSFATCFVNHDSHWANGSLRWYTAGMALAASHLAFVPAVAPKIQAIIEDSSNGQSTNDLDEWLKIHTWRGLTVDLAAWACFVVATVRNLQYS